MTSTRKRTVVRPLSVSSRMRAASSRCRGVVSTPRTPRARRFLWVGEACVLASLKDWAGWKPRFRSWRAASRRWQGLEFSSWPCMTSIRKRTMTRPSSVSSRTMSAREGVVASGLLAWLSVLENIGSMIGRCIRGCQGVGGRIFVYHRERRGHGELVGLGVTRFWKSCAKLFLVWHRSGCCWDQVGVAVWVGWEHVRIRHWAKPNDDTILMAMGATPWRKSVIW